MVTKARKSIANFKLRQGMPIGCAVTLRGDRMYEFLDRLVNVAMPRIRDFRGVSPKAFDGRGNYTIGLKEQTIFPEIDYAKVDKVKGMNITIVTTARNDAEALSLVASVSEYRSETERLAGMKHGYHCQNRQRTRRSRKFKIRLAQPLQALRPAARLYPQVPIVPYLFPAAGPAGRVARRGQEQLVAGCRATAREDDACFLIRFPTC